MRDMSLRVRAVLSRRRFLLGVLASVFACRATARRAGVMVHYGEGKTQQLMLLAARALSRDHTKNTVLIRAR